MLFDVLTPTKDRSLTFGVARFERMLESEISSVEMQVCLRTRADCVLVLHACLPTTVALETVLRAFILTLYVGVLALFTFLIERVSTLDLARL